jgi:hypothetical protein
MANAYTPGLKVSQRTKHRVKRLLPIPGDVCVAAGESVSADHVVAETFLPGDITPLNLANLLSLPPADVPDCTLKGEGDRIEVGDILARTKGIFGMFKSEYVSQVSGTIESVSSVTGQVIVRGEPSPIQVRAYLRGTVVEVIPNEGCLIEAEVTLVQGIFGIGGEVFGPVRIASKHHEQELTADLVRSDMNGAVIVGGSRITADALEKAKEVGVAAVVTGGIDDEDLEQFLGYSLGVAITGSEQVGLTLVITEGFGHIAMAARTFDLLRSREGDEAAVNGATQIRAGVLRPEILIPLAPDSTGYVAPERETPGQLVIDAPVRIIRDPYFGLLGSVCALPSDLQVLASGSRARVLEVELESGERVMIPRANIELIEG